VLGADGRCFVRVGWPAGRGRALVRLRSATRSVGRGRSNDLWGGVLAAAVGCLAFSGQLNWYYFMLRAAGPGTRRGPLEGSGNREPNGDEPDYTGVRCSGQYPPWPFSASGRRYDGPARL